MQQIIYAHQTSQKNACIRPCDINNFTQSLTRKYLHTATERQYSLCGEKISWAPTIAGVSYQFGFTPFLICLKCKISGSSGFFYFLEAVAWRCSVKKARPATLLKKRLWHRCFPVNFATFLRTRFFIEHLIVPSDFFP